MKRVLTTTFALACFVVVALSSPAQATHQPDGFKDFEDEEVLSTLPSGWLQGSSSSFVDAKVSAQNDPLGDRAWSQEGLSGGVSRTTLTATDGDRTCASETNPAPEFLPNLTFAMKILEYPVGDSFYVGLTFTEDPDIARAATNSDQRDPRHHQMRLQINQTGVPVAQIHGDNDATANGAAAVTVSAGAFSSMALNTWYNVSFIDINVGTNTGTDCPATTNIGGLSDFSYNVQILELEQSRSVNADSLLASCRTTVAADSTCSSSTTFQVWEQEMNRFYTKGGASSTEEFLLIDNIEWGVEGAAVTVGTNQTAVDNLVGFDVDATGSTGIFRWGSTGGQQGDNVSAFSATGMTVYPTIVDTNCARSDGVAALKTHVSYLSCDDADPSNVDEIHIRSNNLGDPSLGDLCNTLCVTEIEDGDIASPEDDVVELASVTQFPFDYTVGNEALFPGNSVFAAWAFTTTTGEVGVVTYTWNNNDLDDTRVASAAIASQEPEQVCVTEDDDERVYLFAAASESGAFGWLVDFEIFGTGFDLSRAGLDVQIVQFFSGSTTTNNARSVGCGKDKFAVLTTDTLTVWDCSRPDAARNCAGRSPILTQTGLSSTKVRGLVMSDDGKWVAYVDSDGGHVLCVHQTGCGGTLNATLGEEVYTWTPASGTFRGLEMQGAGSAMWEFTADFITRHDIFAVTTGEDTPYDPTIDLELDKAGATPTPAAGGVILGESVGQFAVGFGGSESGAAAFIGFLIIGGIAYGGTHVLRENRMLGAAVGAGIGVVMAWMLGFLSDTVVFILVTISFAAIFGTIWMRRGG